MFNRKSHFSDFKPAQITPILVMIFSPVALLFVPFPFYPLHASQAGPQNTSQICVLLLQVASLNDFRNVSDIILMKSWCIRHSFDDMFMYPILFWLHFSLSGNFVHDSFWKCGPCLGRKHNSRYRHKAFYIKHLTFSTSNRHRLGYLFAVLDYFSLLWPLRNAFKTSSCSTFPLFGPTKPPHIPITLAI